MVTVKWQRKKEASENLFGHGVFVNEQAILNVYDYSKKLKLKTKLKRAFQKPQDFPIQP